MGVYYQKKGTEVAEGYRNTQLIVRNNVADRYARQSQASPRFQRIVEVGGVAQSGTVQNGIRLIPFIWEDGVAGRLTRSGLRVELQKVSSSSAILQAFDWANVPSNNSYDAYLDGTAAVAIYDDGVDLPKSGTTSPTNGLMAVATPTVMLYASTLDTSGETGSVEWLITEWNVTAFKSLIANEIRNLTNIPSESNVQCVVWGTRGGATLTTSKMRLTPNTPCLLYTSPSPRDRQKSRMPSSA